MSKKSLDDYLMLLKQGKRLDFDFTRHHDSKMGILRNFIRIKKGKPKRTDNISEKQIAKDRANEQIQQRIPSQPQDMKEKETAVMSQAANSMINSLLENFKSKEEGKSTKSSGK